MSFFKQLFKIFLLSFVSSFQCYFVCSLKPFEYFLMEVQLTKNFGYLNLLDFSRIIWYNSIMRMNKHIENSSKPSSKDLKGSFYLMATKTCDSVSNTHGLAGFFVCGSFRTIILMKG